MGYLVDRQRALRTGDIVAVLSVRWRRIRSRVILKDNSLYQTLTRPGVLAGRADPSGVWMPGRVTRTRRKREGPRT
ncbi:MAG TPA: hypothetical protein VGB20_00550 [bacterium]